jgi:hypothetical protein
VEVPHAGDAQHAKARASDAKNQVSQLRRYEEGQKSGQTVQPWLRSSMPQELDAVGGLSRTELGRRKNTRKKEPKNRSASSLRLA